MSEEEKKYTHYNLKPIRIALLCIFCAIAYFAAPVFYKLSKGVVKKAILILAGPTPPPFDRFACMRVHQKEVDELRDYYKNALSKGREPIIRDSVVLEKVGDVRFCILPIYESDRNKYQKLENDWSRVYAFCCVAHNNTPISWKEIVERDFDKVKTEFKATGDPKVDFEIPDFQIPQDGK